MLFPRVLVALVLAGCLLGVPQGARSAPRPEIRQALETYVSRPDTNYHYKLVNTFSGEGVTGYLLEMTSQAWLTTNEVDRPLWKHWLTILQPQDAASSLALLYIGGGGNDGRVPQGPDKNLLRVARMTRSTVVDLRMVPNQPLTFAGETKVRYEDSLIAYTWDKFLRTGDPKWPARLPMTKSAVRAMDTVIGFLGTNSPGKAPSEFVVTGASKRGWTTWTTAAVDPRVAAIIPVVIDVLNLEPSMRHHYGAYGFWAPAIRDYTDFKLMDWTGTPEYESLLAIEDPFSYRERLTMPKFIINASGDQFFLPDSSQFYFHELPGVKYLRYIPNSEHSMRGTDVYETMLTYYDAVLRKRPLPQFSWKMEPGGAIRVSAETEPSGVKVWHATNPSARDFRLTAEGPKWESRTLEKTGGTYLAQVPRPEKGWTAFFVELTFPNEGPAPLKFTTDVRVVPEVLPYKFEPKRPPQ